MLKKITYWGELKKKRIIRNGSNKFSEALKSTLIKQKISRKQSWYENKDDIDKKKIETKPG